MLNLALEPAQLRLKTGLKEVAANKLRAYARQAEDDRNIPEPVRTEIAAFGLPGADGFASGVDDAVSFCLAAEALAWADPGIAYAWLASRQVAWVIASCGTKEQKERWLPRFAKDPFLPASLYMYEGRGIMPSESETEIHRKGNQLIVNGFKSPVMYPNTAVVSVIVGKDEDGKLAATIAEDLGDAVKFRHESDRRLAMTACPSATEARIDDLKLPADAVMKSDGLLKALTVCRLAHASVCIGTAAAATSYAGEYAKNRVAFGKPIIAFQGVSFVLADLLMDVDAAELGVLDVVTANIPPEEAERRANDVIAQANQLVADGGREGVQIMGVAGVITEHPQERMYRSAAVLASIDFDPLNCELNIR